MSEVYRSVINATGITDGYREHASWQSMDCRLKDWKRAHALLGRRIAELTALRNKRRLEVERGEWPPGDDRDG